MALIIKDRIKEGTTSTGTGNISLGGAAATFDAFSSVMVNGDTTYYAVVHTASGVDEWEVGLGTYDATLNEIARTTILSGSAGTSAVNFSAGTKDVFITYPASKALYANADGSVMLPDGLTVMGKIDGATYIEAETHLDLNTTTSNKPTHREGRIFYDAAFGALAVYNDEADVTLQVGQEEYIRVKNNTGSTITNGTPVYLTGEDQATPTIAPAKADGTYLESQAVGVATHDIENNSIGYVTTRGLIADVDTSHLTVGEVVHVAVGGGTQTASPTYPYYATEVGICLISAATGGCIYVSVRSEAAQSLRVTGNAYFDTNVTIAGNLTVLGDQTVSTSSNIAIGNAWNYFNAGDTIGALNTAFSGTGLDDATLTGHFTGTSPTTYYVRIDGVGTGTGGVDTFEWSTDNFVTTVATGVDITGTDQLIHSTDNIAIKFESTTGHTLNDTWTGTGSPVNVDTGFASNRNTGTTGVGYTHIGIYYDVSTNKWTVFDAYAPEPEGAIDITDPSFSYGTLKAGTFEGNLTGNVTGNLTGNVSGNVTGSLTGNVTGNVTGSSGSTTGNAATATKLATARTVQLSGDVTGSATFDGSADINIVATVGDDSHAHIIANVDGLQAALDAKADKTTTIAAGNGFAAGSGGDLSVNRTFTIGAGTGVTVNANDVAIGQDVATTANVTFNNITVTGTVDGRDVAADGTKLDGIEAGATADQTAAEIKTAYESNLDTNAFTDAEQTKLAGIEAGATADQTAAEILTAIKTVDGAGSGLDADTLDGVQASGFATAGHTHTLADITDSGTAAALNVGTGANNVVQLNGSAQLPAVDGSLLTGIEGVPSGVIVLWSGASTAIPTGWVLCDGLNSTPDLRDRFVVGAGSSYAVGATGGSNTVALAETNLPSHSHGAGTFSAGAGGDHSHNFNANTGNSGNHAHNGSTSNTGSHSHTAYWANSSGGNNRFSQMRTAQTYSTNGALSSNGAHSHNFTTAGGGDHSHNFNANTGNSGNHTHSVTGTSGATGSGTAHENRPPYYALCYIMKV